jgi:hypothetical protein
MAPGEYLDSRNEFYQQHQLMIIMLLNLSRKEFYQQHQLLLLNLSRSLLNVMPRLPLRGLEFPVSGPTLHLRGSIGTYRCNKHGGRTVHV